MNLVTEVLTRVSSALTRHGIDHMVIGGQAVHMHCDASNLVVIESPPAKARALRF